MKAKLHQLYRNKSWLIAAGMILLVAALLIAHGTGRVSHSQARKLVERYNTVVCEAYRHGDVRLIDPVVGANEGRKLTGLIGVRQDLGIALDAQLRFLEVTEVEELDKELHVHTRERWTYRDVRLGTDQQVGEASQDAYEMLYVFKAEPQGWMVDAIQFTSPPQVSRKQTPWLANNSHETGEAK